MKRMRRDRTSCPFFAERIEQPGAQTPLPEYAIEIVRGVAEHIAAIDSTLDEHSTGWKVKRMGVVDRNILRIAAWEIMFNDDVPIWWPSTRRLALPRRCVMTNHRHSSTVCSAR